jgi:2,4-dienoyl-CoA reductase-like NADH-dependent reductase (Old Yellow Enzyme family)
MCQYSSVDGMASDWHLVHLGSRAIGGAALVIAEATAVSPEGRISPDDAGLWTDDQIEPLARIVRFIHQHGAVAGIQLAHAGRKAATANPWKAATNTAASTRDALTDAEGGWSPLSPSAIPFSQGYRTPVELTLADIQRIQSDFRAGAMRALAADYHWLELHAAHGYLMHSFLSPLSNQRQDAYGGNFENRIRFILETAACVREVWPEERPLTVRFSCTDWAEGGWTLADSVSLAKRLKDVGVDLIDCSSGGAVPDARISVGAGYQVPFSEAIRHQAGIPTAAVGMILSPSQADEIIRNGRADLVLLGREMLRDPYWPYHAAQVLRQKNAETLPLAYSAFIS